MTGTTQSSAEKRARLKHLLAERRRNAARLGAESAERAADAPDPRADAKLDPEIERDWHNATSPEPGNRNVLLTGATGFLGAFLLDELLRKTPNVVHCLVRASTADEAASRIQQNLQRYDLWNDSHRDRIVPICGDLTQPRLGLAEEVFREMSIRIAVVYHNGAAVNMFSPYPVLRPANVLGTHEVVRFAASHCRKRLHYVSAISVFPLANSCTFTESDPLGPVEGLSTPYGQSKWVAEKLIEHAAALGMDTRVYRPGQITGHSVTGESPHGDLLFDLLQSMVRTRLTLELERSVDLTPVDYVASAIVHLAEQADARHRTYHLCNNRRVSWPEFLEYLRAFGYSIDMVPFAAWQGNLRKLGAMGDTLSARLALLSEIAAQLGVPSETSSSPEMLRLELPTFDATNTLAGLEGSGIACHPPTMQLLHRYLSDFVAKGAIPAPKDRSPGRNSGGAA
jgi:thioester reductase-like protein